MKRIEHRFNYLEYPSRKDLSQDMGELLQHASDISKIAYAPYSKMPHIQVGCAQKEWPFSMRKANIQTPLSKPLRLQLQAKNLM